jgi:putative ABC transport system ATP-binding protein
VARVLPESTDRPGPDLPVDHLLEREAPSPRGGGEASPIVELVDIHKRYQTGVLSVDALRGVSLRIDEGEFVAIIGPSGSGKSTLMHILGCLDHPSSGSYYLAGVDVSDMDEVQLADVRNRRIGFVFQQFNLLTALTACRNVELPLVYAGVDRHDRKRRALASLARVDLANRSEHRPNELSGGQQQRVAVARALVNEPTLVLADEPTGNLDSSSAADVLGLLGDLHRSGRTVVLITHDAQTANTAQRVVRLKDGLIQSDEATSPGGLRT